VHFAPHASTTYRWPKLCALSALAGPREHECEFLSFRLQTSESLDLLIDLRYEHRDRVELVRCDLETRAAHLEIVSSCVPRACSRLCLGEAPC
jgi:hypothetical protein